MNQRVLYVDDDIYLSEAYIEELVSQGFVVDIATSAKDAYDKLKGGSYGVAIIDIIMPYGEIGDDNSYGDHQGIWLADGIRKIKKMEINFVYITIVDDQTVHSMLEAIDSPYGMTSRVLVKPCSVDDLANAVRSALSNGRGE